MKSILTILLLLIASVVFARHYKQCHVYRYKGTDSLNKKLVLTQRFDKKARLIFEEYDGEVGFIGYIGFPNEIVPSKPDGKYYYWYDDTLLVKSIIAERDDCFDTDGNLKTINYHGDTTIIFSTYFFENNGRLVKRVDSNQLFKAKNPWKCMVFEDKNDDSTLSRAREYDYTRVWSSTKDSVRYYYDDRGNKNIEINNSMTWVWEYDSLNRIIKDNYYEYLYTPDGFIKLSYGEWNGEKQIFQQILKNVKDKKGRLVQEEWDNVNNINDDHGYYRKHIEYKRKEIVKTIMAGLKKPRLGIGSEYTFIFVYN